MKKKQFFLVFSVIILVLSYSCGLKKDKRKAKKVDVEIAKTISRATTGVISSDELIKIRFNNEVIKKNLVGTNLVTNVFTFTPELSGVTYWEDKHTLVFKPSKNLELNENYSAILDLKKLFPNDKKLKTDSFNFQFQVASREIVSINGDFSSISYEDPKIVRFTGNVLLTEPIDVKNVKKAVDIFIDNKKVKSVFNFREDFKQFTFITGKIVRNNKHQVKVKINGEKLGVSKDVEKIFEIYAFRKLIVTDIKEKSKSDNLFLQVEFSDDLDKGQNIEGLISIEPQTKISLKKSKNKIIVKGNFKNGEDYTVKINPGIMSKWGSRLESAYSEQVKFLDLKPEIEFVSNGAFLPASNNRKLQFYSTNVSTVHLTVKKVFENNIGMFLQDDYLKSSKNRSSNFYNTNRVGVTVVHNKSLSLGYEKNIKKLNELDLNELIKKDAKGLYLIELRFNYKDMLYSHPNPGRYDSYYDDPRSSGYIYEHGKIYKPVLLSSIGVITKYAKNNFKVFVTDVNNANPMSGIKVQLKSYQNQVVAAKRTNGKGIAEFNNIKNVYYVEAIKDDERSVVILNSMGNNLSSFDVEGVRENKAGVKAFIYTERGVYRPGDEVNFSIIIRNKENTFPDNHPINVEIKNPKMQKVLNKVLKSGYDGFYSFKFKTAESDPTGNWQVKIKAGDSVFHHILKVETVVPYKLKLKLRPDKDFVTKEDKDLKITLDTKYLFGNPAKGLKAQVNGKLKAYNKRLKNYKGYNFKDNSVDFKNTNERIFEGKLNEKGIANIKWTVPSLEFAPSSLIAEINATVFEKGGRPNKQKIIIPVEPYDYYVGIEKPVTEYGYLQVGNSINLNSIVIDRKGNSVGGKPVHYKLYKNNLYWWWEYRNSVSRGVKYKSDIETELIKEGDFVSKNVPTPIEINITDSGSYFLEVQVGEGHTSSIFFRAGYWGSDSQNKDGAVVQLKSNKNKYNPGDIAKITFITPKKGRVLVSLEKGYEIKKLYSKATSGEKETTIEIPITKDMIPNAYASISVIQARDTIENDRPLKMFGVIPLMVEDKSSREEVEIKMADSLESEKEFKVKVQTKDKTKTQFTIAVVDEGLLSLTNFQTPKPYEFFFKKERLQVMTADMFSYIIGANKNDVYNLFSIGGGVLGAAKGEKGGKRRRFEPVSMFKGPFLTDDKGFAEVDFKMPNYIGAVRVMVVTANKNKYGNISKTVPVKKDLMILPTLPRVLHPLDQFKLPVTVFTMKDNVGEVKVHLEVDENVKINEKGKKIKTLQFKKADESDVEFNLKVKDFIGQTSIKVIAESKDLKAEKTYYLNVVPISPRIYKWNVKNAKPLEKVKIKVPGDGIKGSNEAIISIMNRPNLNINHRISYLIRYPYGCIEQTTSSVFPQLYLEKLASLSDREKEKINSAINRSMDRLKRFVTPNGGFAYWPGGRKPSSWGSNYAFHYLITAKNRGYYVPDNLYNSILRYETSAALSSSGYLKTRAYRVYLLALSGNPSTSGMNLLKESSLKGMNNAEKWMLAASYYLTGDKETANRIVEGAGTEISSTYSYDESYGSPLRDKAIILDCATIMERDEVAKKLIFEITSELSKKAWMSTQTTAYSLMSVGKYFEKIESESKNNLMAGKLIYPDGSSKDFQTNKVSIKLPIEKGFGKDFIVQLNGSTTYKQVFIAMEWSGIPSNVTAIPFENKNIDLKVEYLNENGIKTDISKVKQGDNFYILYTVKSNGYVENVSLDQMLASGYEIDNMRLSGVEMPEFTKDWKWNLNRYDYMDMRDDRVVWFFNSNSYGEAMFLVKINAVTKGIFQLPPTVCEAMYDKLNYRAVVPGKTIVIE